LHGWTWGQVIEEALVSEFVSVMDDAVAIIFSELAACVDIPVLLIFDEVNGIFEKNLADTKYFSYASHFNKIVLERGWKLISGTGHARFVSRIPNGLESYQSSLVPWSEEEFIYLLKNKELCPSLLENYLTATNYALPLVKKVYEELGGVPRQLKRLSRLIKNLEPKWIQTLEADEPRFNVRVDKLLALYREKAIEDFERINQVYLKTLSPEDKTIHFSSLASVFAYASDVRVSQDFMDTSLLYYKESVKRYVPINPAAGNAFEYSLRTWFKPIKDNDAKTYTQSTC
jgi:hypothetical protein